MLTILIPTYNRGIYLKKNIEMLDGFIIKNDLKNVVKILISNNLSTDNTKEILTKIKEQCQSEIKIFDQTTNIGLEKNALFVLSRSESNFVMYLGDDDYLDENYLLQVVKKLTQDDKIGCIIPSYVNVNYDGDLLVPKIGRDFDLPNAEFENGFENCLKNSFKGHQLSGLVFRRDGLLESYVNQKVNNLYPFIYFTTFSCFHYNTLCLTEFPVKVTAALQKDKDWGYGKEGLITHVFDNYNKFDEITYYQKHLLQMHLLKKQSWRYLMFLDDKVKFIKALFIIEFSSKTNWITKVFFPIVILNFFFKILIKKKSIKI